MSVEVLTQVEDQTCACVSKAHSSWVSVSGSMIDGSVRPQRSELLMCVCLACSNLPLWQDRRAWRCV